MHQCSDMITFLCFYQKIVCVCLNKKNPVSLQASNAETYCTKLKSSLTSKVFGEKKDICKTDTCKFIYMEI